MFSISLSALPNKWKKTHWAILQYRNAGRIILGLPYNVVRIPHQCLPQHTQGATTHIQCSELPWCEKNMHLYTFKQLLMTRIYRKPCLKTDMQAICPQLSCICLRALWSPFGVFWSIYSKRWIMKYSFYVLKFSGMAVITLPVLLLNTDHWFPLLGLLFAV